MAEPASPSALARVVGVPGAVLLGLGSILGTGIFVSVGIAAGVAGAQVIWAVALAAVVATFNGLSSAQLAAAYPVSGGTYEYGYRLLGPRLGFSAGWMFLWAKSASAATAALGLAGYLLAAFGGGLGAEVRVGLAIAVILALTGVVAGGMRRSNRTNAVIVGVTLLGLLTLIALGAGPALEAHAALGWTGAGQPAALAEATALMFVAYTGYGRVATLGEEIREPSRSIPRAIVLTLAVTATLYVAVTVVAVGLIGADALAAAVARDASVAPLVVAARALERPAVSALVSVAAITAMAGVVLNLLLGLSRVLLAMARRGDAPRALAILDEQQSPRRAVLVVGLVIAGLAAIGSVTTTWSFSAFTVLIYYALTNLAALRLGPEQRRFPRVIPALGLLSCLGLSAWIEPRVAGVGLGLIAAGLAWQALWRRFAEG